MEDSKNLISRQAAIDTVDEMPVMKDNNGIEFIEKSLAKTRIGLLPSAQPEITNEEIRFALKQLGAYFSIKIRDKKEGDVPVELLQRIEEIQEYVDNLPSAQPESTADAEFWRKRANYYSDMCSKLITDMGAGVKIEAVKIDETGITFTKKKPSAQPEPQWIPCSERLPEVGAVLITDGNEIVIGYYHGDSTWSVDGCDYNPDLEKIAWMPLPEP